MRRQRVRPPIVIAAIAAIAGVLVLVPFALAGVRHA